MKLLPPALLLLLISFTAGQESDKMQADAFGRDNFTYPAGNILGLGYSYYTYDTEWPAIFIPNSGAPGNPIYYPIHSHVKSELHAFLEGRSVLQLGPIHLDIRGEIRFGVSGDTKQNYLSLLRDSLGLSPEIERISQTGTNFSIGPVFKFAYPFDISPRIHLAPFVGTGLTFILLEMQGDGLDAAFEGGALNDLSYSSSWNEYSVFATVNAGMNIDFETWSIILDYNRSYWGFAETNWNPVAANPATIGQPTLEGAHPDPNAPYSSTGQTFQGFGVSLAFRIGR